MESSLALEARAITKRFGTLVADNEVDFQLKKGEIHALLGENGAGKTTLCSIMYGFLRPDGGELVVNGSVARFTSPKDAMRAGIGMVHQELMSIPNMTVLENLSLMLNSSYRKPLLDLSSVKARLLELEEAYGLPVNPEAVMEGLSVGERQRVEILKCLFGGSRVVILDEPTSFLTEIETEKLFKSLKEMTKEGRSVVFVTHKIDEVMDVADRITILRQGKVVAMRQKNEATKQELAKLIVGREVMYNVQKVETTPGRSLLEIIKVSAKNDMGALALNDVSLTVSAGEIVGIAGVAGNGQRELVEVITGMRKAKSGSVMIDGVDATDLSADMERRAGVAHISEEHQTSFIFNFSLATNMILSPSIADQFKKGMFVDREKLRKKTRDLLKEFSISATSEEALLWTLSGGNKQKFLLARELFWGPKVIVANNPTKGLDVAAAEYIRNRLMKAKGEGKAVLMVSSDIDEILDMSDRIAIINGGKIQRVMEAANADLGEIAYFMTTGSGARVT